MVLLGREFHARPFHRLLLFLRSSFPSLGSWVNHFWPGSHDPDLVTYFEGNYNGYFPQDQVVCQATIKETDRIFTERFTTSSLETRLIRGLFFTKGFFRKGIVFSYPSPGTTDSDPLPSRSKYFEVNCPHSLF